ncbi:MAG: hypothetical protein AB1352_00750 [Patescibacteria group bacterium]
MTKNTPQGLVIVYYGDGKGETTTTFADYKLYSMGIQIHDKVIYSFHDNKNH